eukprot:m.44163 g.44163  ORF g.44163 m.44163 type:complete len:249 (+) comp10058_c0_seq1:127-873(+)
MFLKLEKNENSRVVYPTKLKRPSKIGGRIALGKIDINTPPRSHVAKKRALTSGQSFTKILKPKIQEVSKKIDNGCVPKLHNYLDTDSNSSCSEETDECDSEDEEVFFGTVSEREYRNAAILQHQLWASRVLQRAWIEYKRKKSKSAVLEAKKEQLRQLREKRQRLEQQLRQSRGHKASSNTLQSSSSFTSSESQAYKEMERETRMNTARNSSNKTMTERVTDYFSRCLDSDLLEPRKCKIRWDTSLTR